MADDLNFSWKTILSLYNTHPSGNIIASFWHQEDFYVSFTLHISEFSWCLQWEYVITAKVKCNVSDTLIPYKRPFFNCANWLIDYIWAQDLTALMHLGL